jgi:hypothetical protein
MFQHGPSRLTGDPELNRDIVEERQRELLQEVEADKIAAGEHVEQDTYRPITDDSDDFVDSTPNNPHIHTDETR